MELQGKRALVTGITGTVGSRIAHRLLADGMQVRALVRRPGVVAECAGQNVEWVQGDLTDAASVAAAVADCQLIVHAAAYIGADPDLSQCTNVAGTKNMVAAALRAAPELFVHISTISVYDLYHHEEFDESSPLCSDAKNSYQATKTEAERVVWAGAEAGLPLLVIRPCNILSVHPTSHWGPKTLQRVAEGFHRWHPEGSFPWIHIDNLTDLFSLAVGTPAAVGQAYTATDGHVTNADYFGRIARWVGNTTPPDGPLQRWHFHVEKNLSLGYTPRVTFAAAMAELEACARAMGYRGA